MDGRLVLLHGWGANGADLKPLGDRLARECSKALEVVCLEAPELHPDQPGGRQWYGLFPAQWDAVPAAIERLKAQLQSLSSSGLGLERTVVFGFSQGGAMALEGGCALPIAGLISCSGYPHPNWAPPQQHPPCVADAWFRRSRGAVPGHAIDRCSVAARSMSDAPIQKRPHHP